MALAAERLFSALSDRYRIERELGQGGMATVYLAEDLKHDRKVAIKVLKPELAAVLGAERFVVEIKTTAALSHPHILPLFDSGTADGFLFYVMPYIKGETIREKLNRETQFGVDEAVRIAREVADALDYAHRHGVIHRDIKPENILLHDGRAMVMDFGIALAVSAAAGGRMTETGLSLGTPHYMSPEQATADKDLTGRSDVYSLASVLYEMLAGQPPHSGGSAQQVIMKILTETPPPVTSLRKSVLPNVAAALAKALEKLPADRFESAKAFAEALQNPSYTAARASGIHAASGRNDWKRHAAIPLVGLSFALLIAAGSGWLRRMPEEPVRRFDLVPGGAEPSAASDVVISPDGSMLAFTSFAGTGSPAIYLRRLNADPDFRRVPGTDGANISTPTFSPDSRKLAFRRQSDGSLLTIDVGGGGATTLTRLGEEIGTFLHWGTDGHIVYSGGPKGLFRIAAAGGAPEFLAKTAGAERYSFLLPDGSGVLFSTGVAGVMILDFRTDSARLLVPGAVHPTYAASGHLLYVLNERGLFAVPFDLATHQIRGSPVSVIGGLAAGTGTRAYSASRNGTLVYREGPTGFGGVPSTPNSLAMITFTGDSELIPTPRGTRLLPRFSPNGDRLVFSARSSRSGVEQDIHTLDLSTGTVTRLTFEGDNSYPVWSPDGRQVLFSRSGDGYRRDLFIKQADNSAPERLVLTLPGTQRPDAWLNDSTIVFSSAEQGGLFDLFRYSMKDSTAAVPYVTGPAAQTDASIAPDGKLVVFTEGSGNPEVWMRDYPDGRVKWQISPTLGEGARWSHDGRYVYFWKPVPPGVGDSLFRARVDRMPAVVVRAPEFVTTAGIINSNRNWDVHPDGKRFVAVVRYADSAGEPASTVTASRYVIATNWFAELRAKVRAQEQR